MAGELLYDKSEALILLGLLGLLIVGGELGFRLGRRRHPAIPEHVRNQVNNIQGALMGLLALLLGFTFARTQTTSCFGRTE